jgi:integrase
VKESRSTERTKYPGIYKVTRGSATRYVVSYRIRGLGQRTKTFQRLADAKEFQGKSRNPEEAARLRRLSQGKVSLADYFPQWLEHKRKLAPSTRLRYENVAKLYLLSGDLGRMRLSEITPDAVEVWVSGLVRRGVPAPTIDKAYRTLRACLSSAEREGKVLVNPARSIETPDLDRREPFFLTGRQVDNIAALVPDRDRALVYFLAYTGARMGEATALRVKNVDLVPGWVTISENAPEVGGRKLEPGKTKSGKIRSVPIFEDLGTELARHLELFGKRTKAGDLDREAFVFTSSNGGPVRQNNWRTRVFQKAAVKAGVTRIGKKGLEPPRVHDLRHTFASLAADAGYTLHEVKTMLGHSTIQITSDLYLHLFPDSMAEKAERLGTTMRDAREGGTVKSLPGPGA